ncbi:MAG: signal peptidase I, partial [Clostridiales bacterium]|nr:signal peptidase I [Clostridiales bacterium]
MKKASEKIVGVISWIFTVISILIMIFTILSSTVLNRNDKNLFGYKAFVVMSDSMSATDFNAGDIVIAKSVDPTTLSAGDIITFQSENEESYGETVTHKIRRLTVDAEGNPGFITYGTTTDTDDETVVTYAFVLGKYLFSIPKLGTFFFFLKTTPGYFICIFVPFMILIVIQAVKSMNLFRKY